MIRKLFFTAAFLFLSLLALAQETGNRQQEEFLYWESVLDAYEEFANAREQLRGSKRAAEKLREKQLRIEELLHHPKGKMTAQQQWRFNEISVRAGLPITIPTPKEEESTPKPLVQPPAQKPASAKKQIAPAPSVPKNADESAQVAEIPHREQLMERIESHGPIFSSSLVYQPESTSIIPPVTSPVSRARLPWHYYMLLQSGFTPWKVGLFAGARHPAGLGFYASWQFHPSFTRLEDTYVTEHPELIWSNGKSVQKEMAAHAGLLAGKGRLVFYLGAGYGSRTVFWQDSDNAWAQIPSASFSGISVEGGGIITLGTLCLGLGVETLGFKTIGVTAGIGINF